MGPISPHNISRGFPVQTGYCLSTIILKFYEHHIDFRILLGNRPPCHIAQLNSARFLMLCMTKIHRRYILAHGRGSYILAVKWTNNFCSLISLKKRISILDMGVVLHLNVFYMKARRQEFVDSHRELRTSLCGVLLQPYYSPSNPAI